MAGNKELNKYLKELTKEELIKEVNKLYGKFKFVKEYYASEFGTDKGKLLESSKAKLKRLILKTGSYIKPEISAANIVVRDFISVSVHAVDKIDLLLYKVEMCFEFLELWGYNQFTNVENTIYNTYSEVVNMIYENKLEKIFAERCEEVEATVGNYGLIENILNTDEEEDETINS
jgi:hypothetical protein